MDPITTTIEQKVAGSIWAWIRRRFARNQELQKRVETLQAELVEERSGRIAFEQLLNQLECRPADDNLYWRKDGCGGPYCPLCLHEKEKLIPVTHAAEGSFYCRLHDHYFETEDRRLRVRDARLTRQPNYRHRSWR